MMNLKVLAILILMAACSTLPAPAPPGTGALIESRPQPVLLETAGGTICNGVRLDRTTLATAAHCLEDGSPVTIIEAGTRHRGGDAILHPAYRLTPRGHAAGHDLAKLPAASPSGGSAPIAIRPIRPAPAEIAVLTPGGELLSVPCAYLGRSGSLIELSCPVDPGWSGAPIVQDGALVGILSARGQAEGLDIIQAADATRLRTF